MYWFVIGAILVIGCVLALVGILTVVRELMQVGNETTCPLPSANRSNAVDVPDELESM